MYFWEILLRLVSCQRVINPQRKEWHPTWKLQKLSPCSSIWTYGYVCLQQFRPSLDKTGKYAIHDQPPSCCIHEWDCMTLALSAGPSFSISHLAFFISHLALSILHLASSISHLAFFYLAPRIFYFHLASRMSLIGFRNTQSIRTVDFRVWIHNNLLCAMSDFADVTKMEFCVGRFNSRFAPSGNWRSLFKRYIERIVLTRE